MIELFSTPIYGELLSLNCRELESFCRKEKRKSSGKIASNICGWQSEDFHFAEPKRHELDELIKELEYHASIFAERVGLRTPLHINSIWVNINQYRDYNISHHHPKCLISGVFYVKAPKESGDIILEHPAAHMMSFDWGLDSITDWTKYTSQIMSYQCKEGQLLLFPSWLMHRVDPNLNKHEDRISISFNFG